MKKKRKLSKGKDDDKVVSQAFLDKAISQMILAIVLPNMIMTKKR
jgi:hypothetical protein